MSRLEQITAFVTVIEEHGFSAAARKMGISTPAVSRKINALEADLQVKLLERSTRKIALTEIGHQYYQRVHKTLHELTQAEMLIHQSQDVCRGELRVMSNRYFAFQYLIPNLAHFMKAHPELQINLELSERFPDLSKENIDIIFGVTMPYMANLIQKKVCSTRYVLCASPEYLKKFGTPISPSDLKDHRYISHSQRITPNEVHFKQGQKIIVDPILSLNDSKAIADCAINGLGIAKLRDYVVEQAIRKGLLIEILQEQQESGQNIYLYYQQTQYLQPKIRRFVDFIFGFIPYHG